jgi:hypothetical protein
LEEVRVTKGESRYPEPDELAYRKERERELAERAAEAAHTQALQETPAMSGFVVWLAKRLGIDPYELAERFPPDTLRRLKYPFASEQLPDGSTRFIRVGVLGPEKQLIHAPTTRGSSRDAIRGGIEVKR